MEDFIQQQPIHGIQDLVSCYKKGAQSMVNSDPMGPKFHIAAFDPGEFRPQQRTFFWCPNFLVTRTYCLHSRYQSGQSLCITNKVFSDSAGKVLQGWSIDNQLPEGPQGEEQELVGAAGDNTGHRWRRGFWNAERTWEGTGPQPGDVNEIVRRHMHQKHAGPPMPRIVQSDLDKSLSAAARRARKAAIKKKRQYRHLRGKSPTSSSSSSSTRSSDSGSSASSA